MGEFLLKERLKLIQSLRKSGDLDQALTAADALIEEHPSHPPGHAARGRVLFASGRVQDAIEAMTEALRFSPGEPAYLFDRARWRLSANDPLGAETDCTLGIAAEVALGKIYYTEILLFFRAMARLEMNDGLGARDDCAQVRDGFQLWFMGRVQTKRDLLARASK